MEEMIRLAVKFARDHPADAAHRLEVTEPQDAAFFLGELDTTAAANVLDHMIPTAAASCVGTMAPERSSELLAVLPVQKIVRVLHHVDPPTRTGILRLLPGPLAARVERTLRFPEDSAGWAADSSVQPLPSDMPIADVRGAVLDHRIPYIYVVDRDHKLVGVLHKRDVEAGDQHSTLGAMSTPNVIRVPARATVAELQRHRAWRGFDALPVVDGSGVYVGAIRHKTLRSLRTPPRDLGGTGSPLDTLLDLAELYWAGIDSLVASLAAQSKVPNGREGQHEH